MRGPYLRLFEAWRKERRNRELQRLPEGFLEEMRDYAKRLREQGRMLDTSSIIGRIAERERENAERMWRELLELRVRKIVEAVLERRAIPIEALTPEEKGLHASLGRLIAEHLEKMRSSQREGEAAIPRGKPPRGMKIVRFLQPIPAIIGVDMKTYGPFKAEDVAVLPEENAENLIRRGIAKEVEAGG
jgi:DNA replication factor GINS